MTFLLQRTWSAFGTKRTSRHAQPMSAFRRKADIARERHDASLGQTAVPLADIDYEIEPAGEVVASIRYPHQQFALEQAVTEVRRLVGKIELRGQ
jgi:hypothetical protein